MSATNGAGPLVEVTDLKVYFPIKSGIVLDRHVGDIKAVDEVSLTIERGETLGLVGESGCGKSTTGRCILRLVEPTSGQVTFRGEDLLHKRPGELRALRRHLQIVFQDPYSSLHPRRRVRDIIAEPMIVQGMSNRAALAEVPRLMETVHLDPARAGRYPHEFSGGQRQRVGIARAIALDPRLVVCDEPVSALDVSIQAQVLNLLEDIQDRLGLAYLFIAHDLSVVRHIADRVCVMYLGAIVEEAATDDVFESPSHPYTQALISAVPIPDPDREANKPRVTLTSELPSPFELPSGCLFRTRCPKATALCGDVAPPEDSVSAAHSVVCHHWRNSA